MVESDYRRSRECYVLKVRQWRGWGFVGEPRPWLENLEKYGVLLAVPEEVLLWLWREPLERKARYAEQIVRDMVEHAVKIRRDEYYPEFTPTIECEQEEEPCGSLF